MSPLDANPDVDDAAELYAKFLAKTKRATKEFNPDQPRDPDGRFAGGGVDPAQIKDELDPGGNHPYREYLPSDPKEATDQAMAMYRSSFINSSNMRAVAEGRTPAPGVNELETRFNARVLTDAIASAPALGSTSWRLTNGDPPAVGDTLHLPLASTAAARSEAEQFSGSQITGSSHLLEFPPETHGLTYPGPGPGEHIVGGDFKVTSVDTSGRFPVARLSVVSSKRKSRVYLVKDWEDEERDEQGRWTSGGGDANELGQAVAEHAEQTMNLDPPVIGILGDNPELRARAEAVANDMGTKFKLGGVAPAAQEGIVRSAEAFHEKYPEARFSINTHDMSTVEDYKTALAVTMAPGAFNLKESEITFNTAFLGDPDKLSSAWERTRWTGFHPEGTGMPNLDNVQRGEDYPKESAAAAAQAVTDHELGHVLGNYVGQDEEKSVVYDVADRNGLKVSEVGFGISTYATYSERELVAEAACSVAGTTPTPAATAIMEEMTKTYNEKAGVGMS